VFSADLDLDLNGDGSVDSAGLRGAVRLAGLASLDVDLPERGTVYLFTTPGGEIEITGRAASAPMLIQAARVAGVAVAILAVLAIVFYARRGGFRRLATPAGSVLLICLGLLALVTSFLLAGLLLLAAGVTLLVRRRTLRTAAS
jgi:hypothetical protein